MATAAALSIGERSYGIIPMRFLPSVTNPESATPDTSNTQVLLIHQKTLGRTIDPTFWCFPKGHAEPSDRDTKHTAMRELKEETGLTVDLIVLRKRGTPAMVGGEVLEGVEEGEEEVVIKEVYINPVRNVGKEVRYWLGLVLAPQEVKLQAEEVSGAEWLGWEQAVERITFPEGKEMLRGLMECLRPDS